ncbi:MAG: hypothetical protein J6Q70_00705 [Clostridia bacterium]|nr:hypothetical protein [Clostridia bacterium]
MEDIVKAIEKLAEKDIVDYLFVIVPIVVSIVAIYISIVTARKQNKIALFERRYNCLFQIKTILNFADTIKEGADEKIILALYDAFWGTNISRLSGDNQIIAAKCHFEVLKKDVEQAIFLFNHKFDVAPIDVLKSFHALLFDAIGRKNLEQSKKEFFLICDKFAERDFKKLRKTVKL